MRRFLVFLIPFFFLDSTSPAPRCVSVTCHRHCSGPHLLSLPRRYQLVGAVCQGAARGWPGCIGTQTRLCVLPEDGAGVHAHVTRQALRPSGTPGVCRALIGGLDYFYSCTGSGSDDLDCPTIPGTTQLPWYVFTVHAVYILIITIYAF